MGDRSSIIVKSESLASPIQFYGHWAGSSNIEAVSNVLSLTQRVGDAGYLAAQLFHEFSFSLGFYKGVESQTGFGIYTVPAGESYIDMGDDNPPVFVNADTGEVEYLGEFYGINSVVAGALYQAQENYANAE